jgi:hypothetical protein
MSHDATGARQASRCPGSLSWVTSRHWQRACAMSSADCGARARWRRSMKIGINLYPWADQMHDGLLPILESLKTDRPCPGQVAARLAWPSSARRCGIIGIAEITQSENFEGLLTPICRTTRESPGAALQAAPRAVGSATTGEGELLRLAVSSSGYPGRSMCGSSAGLDKACFVPSSWPRAC